MSEKPPVFTVTDRRKFTLEGDLRDESSTPDVSTTPEAAAPEAAAPEPATPTPATERAPAHENSKPRLITMPAREQALPPQAAHPEPLSLDEPSGEFAEAMPEPTAQESAAQRDAYRQSSQQLDAMLRQANPAIGASAAVTIEHVIQSIYLSAVVAMGATAEPGQKPRIDIIGARQSIDMLSVLQEKTKGNLSDKEEQLLRNILFELRMMFLEITNAIAQQAQRPPAGKK
jgi:hypothetical protein